MSLQAELDAFLADFLTRVPKDVAETMARANAELLASGIVERALKAGDRAPDFALPNARGELVSSKAFLARGPIVVSFYRGGWCPYCNLELRAYQKALDEIRALGGELVAISPQTPDNSLSTAEKNALSFEVLSDRGLKVAEAFGVAFALSDELRELYKARGAALPTVNGVDEWRLPMPATYVIARDGRIALAHVDPEYRRRLEPADVLATLTRLKEDAAA